MTLRHLDFPSGQVGLYGTNRDLLTSGVYAELFTSGGSALWMDLVDDPDPGITGTVLFCWGSGATQSYLRYVLPASNNKVGYARRFYVDNLPNAANAWQTLCEFRNASNSPLGRVEVDTTGRIVGTVGETVASSTNPAIVAQAWQHVEMAMDTAAGTLEVRVEGVTVLNMTGLVIGVPVAQLILCRVGPAATAQKQYVKDVAIWDGSGSYNNTFMGSIQVRELIPDGDTAFNWLTSSGSTGWNLLDEAPPNDDTDYVYAVDPPPAASRFSLSNLPTDVTSVRGIYAVVRSRKTDGGDGNLQVGLLSGASTVLGANRPITTAYTYWNDVFETDPATGAPWLPSAVNAVQLQINRTL